MREVGCAPATSSGPPGIAGSQWCLDSELALVRKEGPVDLLDERLQITAMPGVHRIASLLKRWVLGTHQGSVTPDHLQSYLEEFTFRFNRRTSRSRGLVFRRLLEQAVVTGPVTEADVTGGYQW